MELVRLKHYLIPNWPAHSNVSAVFTTRRGGVSQPPYEHFNLAHHVGENTQDTARNRLILKSDLGLTKEPAWLQQAHSTTAVPAETVSQKEIIADASYTQQRGLACVVLSADCVPILLCNKSGTEIAAIHAGWRGALNDIIANTVAQMHSMPHDLMAWIGPAIGPDVYEVGPEVKAAFMEKDPHFKHAFKPEGEKYLANLYTIARRRLYQAGITTIYGGDLCTFSDKRFYSYRRNGPITGRMASLIWLT